MSQPIYRLSTIAVRGDGAIASAESEGVDTTLRASVCLPDVLPQGSIVSVMFTAVTPEGELAPARANFMVTGTTLTANS